MFPKAVTVFFFLSFFATLAVAAPHEQTWPTTTVTVTAAPTATSISQCNTGDAQCCNSVKKADDPTVIPILALVGAVVKGVNVDVGLQCTPISVIGGLGGTCNQHPVCCENNHFGGFISLGCSPIIL